ncbi:PKD domain-containing protein [Methanosarcina barkeri]|nr:PKD domain-containing protein [Methanosarcina barkeri]
MNITPKYAKYLLPILLILLFAGTASALPTVVHDTVRGEMYVSSTANWYSKYTTNNFNVPNGTVAFARYYVGIWGSSDDLTYARISTAFNGHAFPTNPSYYSSEMGVTWIPYDVTDYLRPGEINTATINSKLWGDGRQYGTTLVVVLENESKPQMEYWIADGLDWMHDGDYVGYDVPNSITYFNGTVNLSDVQSASLFSTHLTGFNHEDLNGNSLSDPADSTSGEYFNYIRWDNVKNSLVAENQTVNVGRGSDSYCSAVFHALSIIHKNKPDLVPVNLTPSFVTANITNAMTVTLKNQGNKDSSAFNISLFVDDKLVDTQPVASLGSGDNTTVDLNWTPDGSKGAYLLTVVADPENEIVELNETNNMITKLVGIASANSPIAEFSADKTSGDSPLTVNFTDQSTNSPLSWAWDFNNDGTVDSNVQNPTYTYNAAGTYTVKLTVTNAGGSESETKTGYIVVNPLAANFTAIPISGNAPLTVNFTDQSTGTPTAWAWDFENDSTVDSTQQNPTHTYSTPGNYTVSLTVTNVGGNNSTVKTDYITASSVIPVANFSANKIHGISPLSVTFTDQSTNTPTEWLWDFGDGNTSTSQNPTHTYTTVGTYTVKLEATNLAGTSNITKTGYITVSAGVSPVWTRNTSWDIPDIGSRAAPCFVDLDGDGDYDLLIGTGSGITYAYENTGTTSSPAWTKKSEWDVPDDVGNYAKVASADLDSDGDYDLLIGEYTGKIYGYENTGNKSSPMWTRNNSWDSKGGSTRASPCLADLDDDGDFDLLVGFHDGITYGYENIGTKNSPTWTVKSEWNGPATGSSFTGPYATDLDGDGDYDLLIGESDGISHAYENIGTASSPIWEAKSEWNTPDVGDNAEPEVADLDNDGDYDLLIGASNGISYAYENTAVSVVAKPDLILTAFTPESSIAVNALCTIVATVNNTGTENVDTFNATLSVNGTVVDTQSVSGIASGSSALVNFSWTPEAAGDYNLTVTADPENRIAESDETNNAFTVLVTASSASTTLVANFSADVTKGTIPLSVNFTDQSTGSPTSWFWDFGDGTNATEQNVSHKYTSAGNYTVNLTVADAEGRDSKVKTNYITVSESSIPVEPAPIAAFTADVTSGTASLTVNFTDQSTGSPTSWLWDFGDNSTATEQNVSHTYTSAGNYTVNLTVSNADGSDSEVKTEYIVVSESLPGAPVADFAATPTSGDAPLTVNFTDASTGNISSYAWDFDNDGTVDSTEQNPVYTYSTIGNYTVNLTVANVDGNDSEVKTDYIVVSESLPGAPVANFTANRTSGTAPLDVQFTDASTGNISSYAWDFDNDGNVDSTEQNPIHTYTAAWNYTVNLTVTNEAGSNSTVKTDYITVSSAKTNDLTISGIINTVPSSAVFAKEANTVKITDVKNTGTDTLTNISLALYASDVSDGTVPVNTTTISSLAGGAKTTVSLIDPTIRSLEGGTVTYTAVVDPDNLIPENNEANNNASVDKPVKYNGYKGKRYWEGGSDITTKETYDLQGNLLYSTQPSSAYKGVKWTGRTETWTASDLLIPSGSTVEKALLYVPYNWDTNPGGVPKWTATFNGNTLANGTLYTDKSNFGSYANYTYGLYVFDVTDQFDTAGNSLIMAPDSENSNALYPSTLVVVYRNSNETRKQIFINDECDELAYSPTSYGTTLEEATAYAPFTDMSVETEKVRNATLYSFVGSAGPNEGNLLFNGNTVASNAWQGDSSSSNAQVFDVKNYINETGNEAGIQGTTSGGMDALQQILVVEYQEEQKSAPVANFTTNVTTGKAPLDVQFIDASTGNISSYAWDFDNDGTVDSTEQNPVHIYTAAGNYTVNLTVSNADGSDSEVKTEYIIVSEPLSGSPVANFTANMTSGKAPLTVEFTDISTGSPTSWQWDFNNDGTVDSTEQNPIYTYAAAGTYTVNLTVTGPDGNDSEVKTDYIIVSEPLSGSPVANFTANRTSGKAPLDVQFTDASIGNISSYSWDFDNDGNVDSTEQNPIYTYTAAGTYTVNLTVSNADGNDSEVKTGYIKVSSPSSAKPVANFSANPTSGKTPLNVKFTDTSTGSPTSWFWNFGDGSKSYRQDPIHKYSKAGIYTVNLTVKNAKGRNTVTKTNYIKVITKPVANFTSSVTSGKAPLKVTFTDTSTGIPDKWIWDFGDGSKSSHQNLTHKYSKAGTYTVNLTVKNAKGRNTVTKTDYIKVVTKPVADFSATPTFGKTPLTVEFTDNSTGVPTAWKWSFGDGTTSREKNPEHQYLQGGSYKVTLTVVNVAGSSTVTKKNYIKVTTNTRPGIYSENK